MIFHQREVRAADSEPREGMRIWQPDPNHDIPRHALYIALDELDEETAVIVLSFWPVVDELGRLQFDEERAVQWVRRGRLQGMVSFDREQASDVAADRILRVGDVFCAIEQRDWAAEVRQSAHAAFGRFSGSLQAGEVRSTEREFLFIDASAAARASAKGAFYAAAAPTVDERYAERVGMLSDQHTPLAYS